VVQFYLENISFPLPSEDSLEKWLNKIASQHNAQIENINYIFCDDEYLLNINKEYLNHDYYTDIITFPYKEGESIESDIFISIDRVKENADAHDQTFEKELLRVISHGLLHLIGFKDKDEADQEIMRQMESKCIFLYYDMFV